MTIIITGGTRGIGKAIAKILSGCGYRVFICARSKDDLQTTASEIGAEGFFVVGLL